MKFDETQIAIIALKFPKNGAKASTNGKNLG